MLHFRLPPRSKWDLRSFGILRRVYLNSIPMFRDNHSVTSSRVNGFLTFENGTDSLSQTVGNELPLYAAQYPRREHISRFRAFITDSFPAAGNSVTAHCSAHHWPTVMWGAAALVLSIGNLHNCVHNFQKLFRLKDHIPSYSTTAKKRCGVTFRAVYLTFRHRASSI